MELSPAVIEFCKQRALGQVLSCYGDLTYEQVIESLEADEQDYPSHKDIVVWQPFEDQWAEFILEHIQDLYWAFTATAKFALENQDK